MRLDPNEIVRKLKENGMNVSKTARELGIVPKTVRTWRRRATSAYGYVRHTGLTRCSTAPKTRHGTSVDAVTQDRVTLERKRTGACAQRLVGTLKLTTSSRTIHRFLKGKGLTAVRPNHRRPLFQDTRHMHVKNTTQPGKLQMDVKYVTPELSGLEHTCYLYAVMDIWSRWKLGVILPLLDQGSAIHALQHLVPALPLRPDFIQTDNGLEFQAQFHTYVTETLGLDHHYIHKSNPNENAVIERSFRTDQDEFFYWRLAQLGRPSDMEQLNTWYQDFLLEYNTYRPHLSLGLKTPLEKLQSFPG